jgi:Fic family protein
MRRSDPEIAGSYATSARYVITDKGRHAFPAPAEVPALMGDFAAWLRAAPAAPETAFSAHRRWWLFIRSTTAMAGRRDC